MDLKSATNCLIDVLAEMNTIDKKSIILDVGCGTGRPAFYLHEKYHCRITGISTSKRGVAVANEIAKEKKCNPMVQFELRDALDNRFKPDSFNLIWQMESSHLMRDKKKLFSENYRVLESGGVMLLCDLILKKELSVADLYKYRNELEILEKSFGKTKMEPLEYYCQILEEAGFSEIETFDISKQVIPTLMHWKNNVIQNRKNILGLLTEEEIEIFLHSCEIINNFFENNILGYGLIKAKKAEVAIV
jgi:27-O-demethylrifamycin SV methyltransferase